MGSCREILNIQLGSYANMVGSHFWNLQELGFSYNPNKKSEICHDVLFREGLTIRGEVTFTPRVLCVERTDKLPPIPTLENPTEPKIPLWDPQKVEKIPRSSESDLHPFIQDLDAGVDTTSKDYNFENSLRSWGDLLRTRLHPKSILTGYTRFEDDLEDKIRSYVEECDNIQGFHIITDSHDSFPEVLVFLDDEFSSKTRVAIPVVVGVGGLPWRDMASRLLHTFQSFHDTAAMASISVPLSCVEEFSCKRNAGVLFPNLKYNVESTYHTSAILAAFLETFTLMYRTRENPSDMSDVLSGFTARGWKFSASSLDLPFPLHPEVTLQESLEQRDDNVPLGTTLFPGVRAVNSWYEAFALRGVKDNGEFQQYLQYLSTSITSVRSLLTPLPVLPPFPKIFSPHVSIRGSVDFTLKRAPGFEVASTPALAGLHATPAIGSMLENMTSLVSKIDLNKIPNLGLEKDLFNDSVDTMKSFADAHSFKINIE